MFSKNEKIHTLNLDLIGCIRKKLQPASNQNGLDVQILGLFLKYVPIYLFLIPQGHCQAAISPMK